ncbi:2Fe-2S iron-sulfur cluster binding domain-containing protein [Chroococcidiopsis sp. FACHB-1243]|uniref:2Fe-2S iron-sulfur cluster-binding protein n=1 Tax=Chroococcidiopsis sp. [FACHB-1243] TaxID=2692781 RepID=UPI00177CD322|nr:2Fe-2S iron-sulfur cluster-binding protein [Chroococcidiopsis sp. [FACHB-1243]]MBD2308684.1 2Fe-2S iron-sulfur cluster binding domain-containing protein [Chroococcidiopsis sp. [FACHB-1243]]
MLASLRQIQNPVLRTVTGASAAFAIATIVSGAVVGLVNIRDKARLSVYASLLGTSGGVLVGLVAGRRVSTQVPIAQPTTASTTWQDWRNFVVFRKVKESEEITSFYLKPEDNGEIPSFQPGQFLTIKLDIPGQAKPIIRTYSLSDYPEPCEYYRLSIKREPAPQGLDVPPGIASNFLHDRIHEGSIVPAKPPKGKFVLDLNKSLPAVLISNGVGITPMLSMVKACSRLNPNRPIWFLHGARDGRFHAFRDEVLAIAPQNLNLHVHFCYSRPRVEDEGHYHGIGYVDAALVKSLVRQEAEYFLCGSPAFLESLMAGLQESGVASSSILFESFGKPMKATSEKQLPTASGDEEVAAAEIVFAKSGKTLTWHEGEGTILEFAEANDLDPAYSCRAGICGTCQCKIQAGEVTYQEAPTAEIDEGTVLICISKPKTARVVLDL